MLISYRQKLDLGLVKRRFGIYKFGFESKIGLGAEERRVRILLKQLVINNIRFVYDKIYLFYWQHKQAEKRRRERHWI